MRAIIFDAGNVIIGFNHTKICNALTNFSNLPSKKIYKTIFLSPLIKQYDNGIITSSEFYNLICKRIDADKTLTFEAFKEIWTDIFIENPKIEMVLSCLRPEIKVALLSNTNELHWDYVSKLLIVRKYFSDIERILLSFRLKCSKPNMRIFLIALQRCKCIPEEVIYVDDRPLYIETFKSLGGNGIVYNCQTDSVENLLRELSKYGVLSGGS